MPVTADLHAVHARQRRSATACSAAPSRSARSPRSRAAAVPMRLRVVGGQAELDAVLEYERIVRTERGFFDLVRGAVAARARSRRRRPSSEASSGTRPEACLRSCRGRWKRPSRRRRSCPPAPWCRRWTGSSPRRPASCRPSPRSLPLSARCFRPCCCRRHSSRSNSPTQGAIDATNPRTQVRFRFIIIDSPNDASSAAAIPHRSRETLTTLDQPSGGTSTRIGEGFLAPGPVSERGR